LFVREEELIEEFKEMLNDIVISHANKKPNLYFFRPPKSNIILRRLAKSEVKQTSIITT